MKKLHIVEFEIGKKVTYWNGKKYVKAVITKIMLNPISNIVEYKLFYREGGNSKRRVTNVVVTPFKIKESVHFKNKE